MMHHEEIEFYGSADGPLLGQDSESQQPCDKSKYELYQIYD